MFRRQDIQDRIILTR